MKKLRRLIRSGFTSLLVGGLLGGIFGGVGTANGQSYRPADGEGVFAVITHRGGIAASLSHNHLIVAPIGDVKVEMNALPSALESGKFGAEVAANKLVVDDPEMHKTWIKRLTQVGIMSEDFEPLSASDRADIRTHMLGGEQLDAVKYPDITVELVGLVKQPGHRGDVAFTHIATIRLKVHGKSIEVSMPANVTIEGAASAPQIRVEAVGQAKFTDFGIEPVSAMLGAIQVLDEFDLYVNFVAHKV